MFVAQEDLKVFCKSGTIFHVLHYQGLLQRDHVAQHIATIT